MAVGVPRVRRGAKNARSTLQPPFRRGAGKILTTSAGEAGSRALGEVHNAVRLELAKADADALSDTLNATLVRWLVELNLPGAPPPRLWWNFSTPDDLNTLAERDKRLSRIGFRPTLERITDVYGAGYEALAAPAAGQAGLAQVFAERAAPTGPKMARPHDAADDLALQLNQLPASSCRRAWAGSTCRASPRWRLRWAGTCSCRTWTAPTSSRAPTCCWHCRAR